MAVGTSGRVSPHACRRCGGAAYFNARDGEWACMLCARPVQLPGRPRVAAISVRAA